jgi:hypothetical protein
VDEEKEDGRGERWRVDWMINVGKGNGAENL